MFHYIYLFNYDLFIYDYVLYLLYLLYLYFIMIMTKILFTKQW